MLRAVSGRGNELDVQSQGGGHEERYLPFLFSGCDEMLPLFNVNKLVDEELF